MLDKLIAIEAKYSQIEARLAAPERRRRRILPDAPSHTTAGPLIRYETGPGVRRLGYQDKGVVA